MILRLSQWAKSHLLEFSIANRPGIVAIPLGRQMAIYNFFSSAKKQNYGGRSSHS